MVNLKLYLKTLFCYCNECQAENIAGTCMWRELFSDNYFPNDLGATFAWLIESGTATAAGVGGGGFYVPLSIILIRFGTKQAAGLSQASIFGGSIAAYIMNLPARYRFHYLFICSMTVMICEQLWRKTFCH